MVSFLQEQPWNSLSLGNSDPVKVTIYSNKTQQPGTVTELPSCLKKTKLTNKPTKNCWKQTLIFSHEASLIFPRYLFFYAPAWNSQMTSFFFTHLLKPPVMVTKASGRNVHTVFLTIKVTASASALDTQLTRSS